jgi:hypothetical protein
MEWLASSILTSKKPARLIPAGKWQSPDQYVPASVFSAFRILLILLVPGRVVPDSGLHTA